MKTIFKHFLTTVVLLLVSVSMNAEVYSGDCGANGDNVKWTLDTETATLTITGVGAMADYDNSNKRSPWCGYIRFLKEVYVAEGVTSIGHFAFYYCSYLTSITIPEGVTTIGSDTFYGCSGLTSINIPEGVTSIGSDTFYGCSGLTSITIPSSVTSIGGQAFQNCYGLTSINIPESVTSIGNSAFQNCSRLPIENNLRYADTYLIEAVDKTLSTYNIKVGTRFIGSSAFSDCSNLTSITIPKSVTSIGAYAFSGCSGLTSVKIPEGVTSIGRGAFSGCTSLIAPVFNSKLFAYLPSSYQGSYGIPKGIETICGSAFSGCSGLTSITIPESVTSIGESAFNRCSSLTSITIPEGVTSIGAQAFRGSGLTSITIPSSVTSIGHYAFQNCSNLSTINAMGSKPPTIVKETFDNNSYQTSFLYVPVGCEEAYGTAEGWKNFSKIREKDFGIRDCLLAIKNGKGGYSVLKCKTMTQYSFLFMADEGWKVSSVSFNGSGVTSELAQDGSYTTPALTGDSELSVVFEQDGNEVKEVGEDGQLRVFASGSVVTIQNNGEPQQVSIYTTDGKAVKQTIAERGNTRITLNEGNVYLLKIGDRTFKVAM